jgi:hypothetical protein
MEEIGIGLAQEEIIKYNGMVQEWYNHHHERWKASW